MLADPFTKPLLQEIFVKDQLFVKILCVIVLSQENSERLIPMYLFGPFALAGTATVKRIHFEITYCIE
jgi:hypothetical protein